MNSIKITLFLFLTCGFHSCVQKSYTRNVKVLLDVSAIKDIQSVGIRGSGKPLSWNKDFPMQELVKDSLYTAVVSTKTGYTFGEFKFTVNGVFELAEKENRRVYFSEKDTTYFNAVFDKELGGVIDKK